SPPLTWSATAALTRTGIGGCAGAWPWLHPAHTAKASHTARTKPSLESGFLCTFYSSPKDFSKSAFPAQKDSHAWLFVLFVFSTADRCCRTSLESATFCSY